MTVYQCPKCELRFSYETEVEDHLEQDHHHKDGDERDVPTPPKWHHAHHTSLDDLESSP
jgi:uncharacterized C2H2 Zn-finger protein